MQIGTVRLLQVIGIENIKFDSRSCAAVKLIKQIDGHEAVLVIHTFLVN